MSSATVNGRPAAFWTGALACSIAWFLTTGNRKRLIETYRDYVKRGASDEVRSHLEAIWKGDPK